MRAEPAGLEGPPAPRRIGLGRPRLLLAVASGLALVALTVLVVLRGGTPTALDAATHRWFLDHRGSTLSDAAVAVSFTGTGVFACFLAAVSGAVALAPRPRWWLGAAVGAAALAVGQLVRAALALAVGRARPRTVDWISHASGFAFPSGHTTTSALVAAGLAAAIHHRARRPAARTAAAAGAGLWALAVGVSRVCLGVHWPTDVLAGWLLATVLAAVGLPWLAALLAWIGRDQPDDPQ
ncbi:phosphatase PAP2 family protein [Pseudofrankia asymbiotica]|uniref:PA-phosphatase n=1 Tax=Pseudofrankia asymbiotica TaxID=1834516 RepID=A0A1V2HZK1_9ACTN|nr:phosphatase PAP2 family protein [Pseudofrankia asymbiotica]ONH22186.1 PA-phosphatase [Pseudofrankia asymbiotica]